MKSQSSSTLNELEQTPDIELDDNSSFLIIRCTDLRKKKLSDFSTEDLRVMIGQNQGLKYLIPIAIDFLSKDLMAAGDYYEGDLLISVLRSDSSYWLNAPEERNRMIPMTENIASVLVDIEEDIANDILQEVVNFKRRTKTI